MPPFALPDSFSLGVCYYPEQWPRDRWDAYAAQMRDLGISWARIGEFAWSRLEPEEGAFQWDWLDGAIDSLAACDLGVVLGTPTAAPPPWLIERHPEILPVGMDGQRRNPGARKHYDHASPIYREHCARIVRAMAVRYGEHDAVIGWQIDNEWGDGESCRSYGPASVDAFRRWLQQRYRSLDRLNEAWGATFWSGEFTDWSQVGPPILQMDEPNPSHALDYFRFCSDNVVEFQNLQVAIIRELSPGRFVTHNGMGHFGDVDYYRLAESLDFLSWDSYPTGQPGKGLLPGLDPNRWARTGHPDLTSLNHDLMRDARPGPGPIVMEQQAGQINWDNWNPLPPPGAVSLWTVQAWAHGCQSVSYFRWRASVSGQEIMHSGLLRHDETLDRGGEEVANLDISGATVLTNPARIALLHDHESLWIGEIQPHARDWSYWKQFTLYYSVLRRMGVDVDIRHVDADLGGYDVIVAPAIQIVDEARARRLTEAARQATLVFGPRTGFRDTTGKAHADGQPGPLAKLLGYRLLNIDSLRPGMTVAVDEEEVVTWAESYRADQATVLFTYDDGPMAGQAAVVRNGNCVSIGAISPILIARVLAHLLTSAGIGIVALDDGVRVSRRGPQAVWLNFNEEPTRIPDGRELPPVSFLIE